MVSLRNRKINRKLHWLYLISSISLAAWLIYSWSISAKLSKTGDSLKGFLSKDGIFPKNKHKPFDILDIERKSAACKRGGISFFAAYSDGTTVEECICGGHILPNPPHQLSPAMYGCENINPQYHERYQVPIFFNQDRHAENWYEHEKILMPYQPCYNYALDIVQWNWGFVGGVCDLFLPSSTLVSRTIFAGISGSHIPEEESLSEFYLRLMCHFGPHTPNSRILVKLYLDLHKNHFNLPRTLTFQEGQLLSTLAFIRLSSGSSHPEDEWELNSYLDTQNISISVESKNIIQLIENRRENLRFNSTCSINLFFFYLVQHFNYEEEALIRLFLSTIADDCSFFVFHLDKRSTNFEKMNNFTQNYNREQNRQMLHLIQREHSMLCSWGDPSLTFAELIGIMYAMKIGFPWDYLINLSVTDLPTSSKNIWHKMRIYLQQNYGRSFAWVSGHNQHQSFLWTRACEDDPNNCCHIRWDTKNRNAHYAWQRMQEGFNIGEKYTCSLWHILHRGVVESIISTGAALETLLSIQFVNLIDEAYWIYMVESFLVHHADAFDDSGRQRWQSPNKNNLRSHEVDRTDFNFIKYERDKKHPTFIVRKVYLDRICEFTSELWDSDIGCHLQTEETQTV